MENSILLRPALVNDATVISTLADKIWRQVYTPILSKEQIDCMLREIYDPEFISKQIRVGIAFAIAEVNRKPVGFTSFMPKENESAIYRIEKLYILPEYQGLGIGKKMLKYVEKIAKTKAYTILELNVNRNNPAINFYEKVGFKITRKIDISYHNFILNDFIMQKSI
jgi:ribosomal protein S18 acetylase RimI-like enzyme